MVYAEPRREVVEIGLCNAQGACAEGDVSERRQCEPIEDSTAFDRARHRWTGQPHAVVEPTPEQAPDDGEDDHPPGETSPSGGSCAGCAVPAGSPSGLGLLAAAGALGLWLTRR
ncbi:MAG: hypothetical protein H6719_38785 [Sandaracinaceae bacterium]|nr:hypothetical protein [Sandaracinaceae bacterium]